MMGWSPGCYIPSFMEIGQPVLEEKIFEGFLPHMGVVAILVMWPASCHQIFISWYLKTFKENLVQIGTVVSRKILFEFVYVHSLGPRSRNDLDLQYSHIFIYSLGVCSYYLLGHWLQYFLNQRTNGPVNAHLISWPGKAQNIENLENIL